MARLLLAVYLLTRYFGSASAALLDDDKSLKICSIVGGLDIARLFSSYTRNFFQGAIEDVELIREYISEAAVNGGIAGFHDLEAIARTVDWKARNLTSKSTTVEAGLGYCDDRSDRRVERFVSLANEPLTGDKASDLSIIDSAANIFPWIVDRKSVEEKWWLKDHQNGRSEGPTKEKFRFEQLYVAAWIGTLGEAWLYYPPMRVYGHPLTFGDILGPEYNSHHEEFVEPNLPENNKDRRTYFTEPYADSAMPGLSLITAQAPIYFTGKWQNHTYFNTYIASCGVDLSVEAVSTLLEELDGSLTKNSFACLVDAESFHMIVISQPTVEKIYPPRTGFEESRITYDHSNGEVISDRRNQTYLVSDTIFQPLTDLDNANWTALQETVALLQPGERSYSNLDIQLTGDETSTTFNVMYERWPSIADWALVLFVPEAEINNAINVFLEDNTLALVVIKKREGSSSIVDFELTIVNSGTLAVKFFVHRVPEWIEHHLPHPGDQSSVLAPGEKATLHFTASTHDLDWGKTTSLIGVSVQDDDFPDCYHDQELTATISIQVTEEPDLHQIERVRPYGYALAALICVASMGWSIWTFLNAKHNVVKLCQPIFLHMMCAGTFFMGVSIIPLGIDDSIAAQKGCDIACQSFAWLMASGFSISFSALFSKIWRINQIFRASRNCRRVRVSVRHVMVPFLLLFSLNLLFLALWTAIDPLTWVRSPMYESSGSTEHKSFGRCSLRGSTFSTVCMCMILTINFAALVLAMIQIYRSHDVVGRHREEVKMLTIAMASMMQVFLTGFPILVIVTNNPPVAFFVKTTTIFVVAMSLLFLIFGPMFRATKSVPERAPASVAAFGTPSDSRDDSSLWSRSGAIASLEGGSWHGRSSNTVPAQQRHIAGHILSMQGRRNTYAEGMAESCKKIQLETDFQRSHCSNESSLSLDVDDLSSRSNGNGDIVSPFEDSCATALVSNISKQNLIERDAS